MPEVEGDEFAGLDAEMRLALAEQAIDAIAHALQVITGIIPSTSRKPALAAAVRQLLDEWVADRYTDEAPEYVALWKVLLDFYFDLSEQAYAIDDSPELKAAEQSQKYQQAVSIRDLENADRAASMARHPAGKGRTIEDTAFDSSDVEDVMRNLGIIE